MRAWAYFFSLAPVCWFELRRLDVEPVGIVLAPCPDSRSALFAHRGVRPFPEHLAQHLLLLHVEAPGRFAAALRRGVVSAARATRCVSVHLFPQQNLQQRSASSISSLTSCTERSPTFHSLLPKSSKGFCVSSHFHQICLPKTNKTTIRDQSQYL